jgi:hypothetical protein
VIPLKPVRPQEKLPLTYHLTIVRDPGKGPRVFSVIGTVQQGEETLSRKVFFSTEDKQEALDELNRRAIRAYYFEDTESWESL